MSLTLILFKYLMSLQLKEMEEDGLILRTVYTSKPPLKVKYQLTEFGTTLIPLLKAIAQWGTETAEKKSILYLFK